MKLQNPPRPPSSFAAKTRRVVFLLHLWLGLLGGLYLVLMGVTGSLITFGHELDAQWNPHLHHVTPRGERVAFSQVLAAAQREFPGESLYRVRWPQTPTDTYDVYGEHKPQRPHVFVDPYSGQVLGKRRLNESPLGFADYLHVSLMFGDPDRGSQVSSYGAMLSLVLLLSGLFLWWPSQWKQLATRLKVKRGTSRRRLMHDLHNAFGVYSLPLLGLLTVTGLMFTHGPTWDAISSLAHRVTGTTEQTSGWSTKVAASSRPQLSPDVLLRVAQTVSPEIPIERIWLPRSAEDPFKVGRQPTPHDYIMISVDPYSGRIAHIDDSRQAVAGTRIMNWTEPLHFGTWGGVASKWLYVFVGLVPVGLFFTGFWKWREKRRGRAKNQARHAAQLASDASTHESVSR